MRREEFKLFVEEMYLSANNIINADGDCLELVNCDNCPASGLNRIDNTIQCWRGISFKDQKGEDYTQRSLNYFKEFIKLYNKENKEKMLENIIMKFYKDLSEKVNDKIIDNNFRYIDNDKNTITIECDGITIILWISNCDKNVYIFSYKTDKIHTTMLPKIVFKNSNKCKKILLNSIKKNNQNVIKEKIRYYQEELRKAQR